MKILIVHSRHHLSGGDSTYSFNLGKLLEKHGHQVSYFAMQDEANLPDDNADLFVSNIDFKALNQNKTIANGFKVLTRSIYSREARKKFSHLLERVQPDIIHIQSLHGHLTPSIILEARKKEIPMVWTLHDFKMICPNTSFLNDATGEICEACTGGKYYQAALKRCKKGSLAASTAAALEAYAQKLMSVREKVDVFISPSNFLRTKLLENDFQENHVLHVPNFLSEALLREAAETDRDLGNDKDYMLFFGRVTKFKGVETLLQAAQLIPEVQIKIVGPLDSTMEHIFDNLPPNVTYMGPKYGPELNTLIKNSMAIVLPAVWYENQPFSILEAFAFGKPVITSDLGGMSELVKDNERGILIPPNQPQALAHTMSYLNNNPNIAAQLGESGQKYVRSEHAPKVHYQHISTIYERLVKTGSNTFTG